MESQWQKVQSSTETKNIYANLRDPNAAMFFPIEFRHIFAQWIEEQPWKMINPDDESQLSTVNHYATMFFSQISNKINELSLSSANDSFLLKMSLEELGQIFRTKYENDPCQLVRVVQHCLASEQAILDASESAPADTFGFSSPVLVDPSLNVEVNKLEQHTAESEEKLKQLQQRQEYFVIQYQEWSRINGALNQLDGGANPQQKQTLSNRRQALQTWIGQEGQGILQSRREILEGHAAAVQHAEKVQERLVGTLDAWQESQRKKSSSADALAGTLNQMQPQFESMAFFYWTVRQQLRQQDSQREQLQCGDETENISMQGQINDLLHSLLERLVRKSFVVVQQPPQVMKTQTKFAAKVRVLVGAKLNIHLNPPEVKADIVNERQAVALVTNDQLTGTSGDLLNGKQVVSYSEQTKELCAAYKNLSLKKIKRRDTKKDDVVTEEKFALVFVTSVVVGELTYKVWCLSNPVVVIVHGNQYYKGEATVMWDNSFGAPGRLPWDVPESVPWHQAAAALNHHFLLANGHGLSEDALAYLASKALTPEDGEMLSWARFNRDVLPGKRQFSFWDWFFSIEELVKKQIAGPWSDGCIAGFVSRGQAQRVLMGKPRGTFLLRFSDSELGGVSVAWTTVDKAGRSHVYNLQPWFARDLGIRAIADRIRDLPQLQYLYPDVPKDAAFGKYYSMEPQVTDEDYVVSGIAAVVLGDDEAPQDAGSAPIGEDGQAVAMEATGEAGGGQLQGYNNWQSPFSDESAFSPGMLEYSELDPQYSNYTPMYAGDGTTLEDLLAREYPGGEMEDPGSIDISSFLVHLGGPMGTDIKADPME